MIDAPALEAYIEAACGKAGRKAVVTLSQLDALPGLGEPSRGSAMAAAGRCPVSSALWQGCVLMRQGNR